MKYTDEQLLELQRKECSILEEIDAFCRKHEIEYFIIGGTALGAVRHGGFIPWDDDIDIGMTRENYERFLQFSSDAIGEKYVIASRKYEKNCPFPYPKVRLKGTEFWNFAHYGIKNISTGVYVDVFPFDKIPEDKALYEQQFNNVQKLSKLYALKKQKNIGLPPKTAKEHIKQLVMLILWYVWKLIPDKILLDKLNSEMTKYNITDSKEYCCLFFPKMYTEYGREETLFPVKDYKFENITVKGPNDMDTYLKSHYGNYMELPPEKDRVGHQPYMFKI
jgi:lipopolysaccharide cholinephosphotransferase